MSDSPRDVSPDASPASDRSIDAQIAAHRRAGDRPNRLIDEKSPYLLQHAFNPVDWHPWGEEAFEAARRGNKPIFLSIGYSTCYWCHVMEREVFEDPAIARLMNELVISVKVDREERPDVDRIYMAAVQAMTGAGGWPMSVFLTPDLKPFYGATYIPPVAAHGRPGFPDLLKKIDSVWKADPDRIAGSGEKMMEFLREIESRGGDPGEGAPSPVDAPVRERALARDLVRDAARIYSSAYDSLHGGFGGAPKFPRPASIAFLLAHHRRTGDARSLETALGTLRAMAAGGMYDHLGGGFHRYSVDAEWHVPHFEKMLYDQAQLAVVYLDAHRLTGEEDFLRVAGETLGYVLRDLRDPEGGFYSAEDAESRPAPGADKVEGAYYVWTTKELVEALGGERARAFAAAYDVRDSGNARHDPLGVFPGKNILHLTRPPGDVARDLGMDVPRLKTLLAESRAILFERRARRPRPHLDDKILSGWNGLMIGALAKGYQVTGDRVHLDAAAGAARFLSERMSDAGSGRLHRRYRDGEAKFEGGLQDYAFVVQGLLDLYEATFDPDHLRKAVEFSKTQAALFRDTAGGAWFDTPSGDATLLLRLREEYDGAEPSGNSVTALNLFRLARLTDDSAWRGYAEGIVRSTADRIARRPDVAPLLLAASFWADADPMEIVVAGKPDDPVTRSLLAEVRRRYLPFSVVMLRPPGSAPDPVLPGFLASLGPREGSPLAYVCRNYSCRLPTGDPAELGRLLDGETAASIETEERR